MSLTEKQAQELVETLVKAFKRVEALVTDLEHRDRFRRADAAKALGKIGSEAAIPKLLKILQYDESAYVRRNAAEALGNLGSETAIPTLLKALTDYDRDVCYNAAKALGNLGNETAIPELLRALFEALPEQGSSVHVSAVEALKKLDSSEFATIELIKILDDQYSRILRSNPSTSRMRWSTAEALGILGNEVAVPVLLKTITDPSLWVFLKGLQALEKIGSKAAIPALLEALKHQENMDRRQILAKALEKLR